MFVNDGSKVRPAVDLTLNIFLCHVQLNLTAKKL